MVFFFWLVFFPSVLFGWLVKHTLIVTFTTNQFFGHSDARKQYLSMLQPIYQRNTNVFAHRNDFKRVKNWFYVWIYLSDKRNLFSLLKTLSLQALCAIYIKNNTDSHSHISFMVFALVPSTVYYTVVAVRVCECFRTCIRIRTPCIMDKKKTNKVSIVCTTLVQWNIFGWPDARIFLFSISN